MSENLNEIEAPACPEMQRKLHLRNGRTLGMPHVRPRMGTHRSRRNRRSRQAPRFSTPSVTTLVDGDSVTIVKGLKVKGGADIKAGTKVRGIRLLESPVNGHDIEAKVPGAGQMYLKSSVVKKA